MEYRSVDCNGISEDKSLMRFSGHREKDSKSYKQNWIGKRVFFLAIKDIYRIVIVSI